MAVDAVPVMILVIMLIITVTPQTTSGGHARTCGESDHDYGDNVNNHSDHHKQELEGMLVIVASMIMILVIM